MEETLREREREREREKEPAWCLLGPSSRVHGRPAALLLLPHREGWMGSVINTNTHTKRDSRLGLGVVPQPVQQALSSRVPDREVAALRAEGRAVHVVQRRLGGRPVLVRRARGQVDQPQRVSLHGG